MQGLHIYMIGVGVQEAFIVLFSILLARLHMRLRNEAPRAEVTRAIRLLYIIYAVLTLITIRIIFRLVEYSSGLDSQIPNHEAYMFILESLPMFVAIMLFNVVHPGAVMPGKENNIPGRKERKAMFPKGQKALDKLAYEGVGYESVGRDGMGREELPYNNVAHEHAGYAGGEQSQAELGFLAPHEQRN